VNQPGPAIEGLVFLDRLGTGGYSEVYLYERRSPRMKVAVKVLKNASLTEAELLQFAAEAETMAELADHPYIVQVFSTDVTADGRPYLVMKYYPPPNLGIRAAQGRLSVAEVLRTGIQISSAVETAHRAGILHRDIKPANILLSQYGEPGLTDFGIAGRATDAEEADDLGVSSPWSPPEVLSGASNGSVQSDVYSLGATLWHLLAGRSPFEVAGGDNTPGSLMARVLRLPPPPTGRADVPAALERLLQQAMAKIPALRPKSALDFARALQVVEQEQRLARTDIVVEGLRSAKPSAVRPETGGDDQTRLRGPVRVADPPVPAPQFEGRSGLAAPPTVARPARPAAAPQPLADGGRSRARNTVDAPPATVLRPSLPTAKPPEEQNPTRRGLKAAHIGMIGAGVLGMAVVVGIAVTSGKSKSHSIEKSPSGLATDQLTVPDPPLQPTVRASYDARAKKVHFTWSYGNPELDDYFLWAPKIGITPKRIDGNARLDLTSTRPAATCIVVKVVRRDGQSSLFSDPVCG
jgi:hypothetical protein